MKRAMKHIALVAFVLTVMITAIQYVNATNTTKVPVAQSSVVGWGNGSIWTTTGTALGTADTQIVPVYSTGNVGVGNNRDSIDVIVNVWSNTGSRSAVKVRLQQSSNGTAWTTTSLGTDSTSFSTVNTTLAGASVNRFPIGNARYGTFPYNRLLIIAGHTGGTADTAKYRIDVLTTVNGR